MQGLPPPEADNDTDPHGRPLHASWNTSHLELLLHDLNPLPGPGLQRLPAARDAVRQVRKPLPRKDDVVQDGQQLHEQGDDQEEQS